jgi:hypothetical protein
LIFLDESGVTTQMTRGYARASGGRRVHEATPGGHWKILTILSALSLGGLLATMTIEEATDGDIFLTYLEQVLGPKLRPGDVVVMDNLSAHKVAGVEQLIQAAALFAGPESDREGLGQAETTAPLRQGPHRRGAQSSHRGTLTPDHTTKRPSLVPSQRNQLYILSENALALLEGVNQRE